MDATKQVEKFRDFMEANYVKEIHTLIQKGAKSLIIDFKLLAEFDPELSELLIAEPEEVIKAAELALEQFEITKKSTLDRVRIKNLPLSSTIKIGEIRSKDLGKFISAEGIVRQSSDVRPQVTYAKFECAACGNTISIPQLDSKFKEPSRCTCGMRGRFRLLSKILIDAQHLKIEEIPEKLEGGEQPKRLSVFLKEDLVEPHMERKCSPGAKVIINGIVKEVPVQLKTGAQSIRYDIILEANYIEPLEEDFSQIEIKEEEIQDIIAFSKKKDAFELLSKAIAPSISGHDKIKEALVLQMLGGCRVVKPDKTTRRGDIHMLLCGDPGSGKSVILQFISKAAPKARFVSGKGSSGAGLCIAPESLVLTNPGGIHKIKDLVEENLSEYSFLYQEGVWASTNPKINPKIFTLNSELKVEPKKVNQLWRIKPSEEMIKIKTQLGKEIILTPNTSLLLPSLTWEICSNLKLGNYVATARNLSYPKKEKKLFVLSLIKSNPVVHEIKEKVKELIEEGCIRKKITKRELAKRLELSELSIYHNWVKKGARGNIKLNTLRKISDYAGIPLEMIIDENTEFSLYNGKKIKLPKYLNKDILYFAGLISGDGDLTVGKNSVTVRFSNNTKELMDTFKELTYKLFNVIPNMSSNKSEKRSESWRFSSVLVFELLDALGIPKSPKSDKIDLNNIVLCLSDNLLSSFLKGYYDTDGGPVERLKKGGCGVESGSASKIFSEKIKLVLLRYGITSKIRIRDAKPNAKINSQHKQHIVLITGKENLERFEKFIGFNHSEKRAKLRRIINKISKYDTNLDIIPNVREMIRKIEKDLSIKLMNRHDKNGISKKYLQKISNPLDYNHEGIKKLKLLANSDILWEKITNIEIIRNHRYQYVYDLTVEDSHNFVANGILVHNTAAVVKDEFLKGWSLEAGALVLANKGLAVVDELDKMSHEDRSALHEALEQQTISISKANIQATLRSETTLLAAANPKLGRFDPYSPIAAQIDLPSTLINRFDLIFPVRDIPSKEKDERIAMHVLQSNIDSSIFETEVTQDFLKKYIAYAKTRIKPELTKAAINEIKNFYVTLRNSGQAGEAGIKPIPISARQLEGLIRLSEASAKVRLSDKVGREDAQRAISLMKHCLTEVGIDPETGQIDIDRISTGISASKRGKIITIKDIINTLTAKGMELIPIEEIIAAAAEKGIEESVVEEAIEKLKRDGDLAEIKKGHVTKI